MSIFLSKIGRKKNPYYRKIENVDPLIQLVHETNPGSKRRKHRKTTIKANNHVLF